MRRAARRTTTCRTRWTSPTSAASTRSPPASRTSSCDTEQYWVLHDDLIDVLATTTHPARPWHPWHRPITSPGGLDPAVGRRAASW